MRRLVVELPLDEFIQMKGAATFYRSLESFVLVQVLREGPAGATSVVRIRPRDPHVRFAELERSFGPGLQLLVEADGAFTCLMKVGSAVPLCRRLGLKFETGYIVPPMEVAEDRARITFVGSSAEVARLLSAFRRMRYRHRVVSLSDYQLPPQSPLNALTDQQRRVVSAAYRLGYYDRPRRISSSALARKLGLSSSTLVNHRLKAERRLLSSLLEPK